MEYKYLGWQNGWTETPEIVKNCHHKREYTEGSRCCTHVTCHICKYSYDVCSD